MYNWEVGQVIDLAKGYRGVSYSPENLRYQHTSDTTALLRSNNIQNGFLNWHDIQIVDSTIVDENKILRPGDVAVCMSNGSKALVGKAALFREAPTCTTIGAFCSLFRPHDKKDGRFLAHLFQSHAFRKHIDFILAGSAINNLRNRDIESFTFLLPSIKEREIISDILDHLDNQIQKTETLIAKLKQVKEGLLNDMLTRGINTDGQLRPSFQQAPHLYKKSPLGWIPKEWHTGELDNALNNIEAGKSPSCPDMPAHTGEWGVLKVSAVHPDGFREHENKVVEPAELQDERYEVKSGDLLITRANTPELVGLPCLVHTDRERLMLSDKTLRLHVKEGYEKAFIFISLTQPYVRSQIQIAATGTSMSMKNISQNSLKRLNMKFPPHAEQVLIAERILDAGRRISEENALLKKMEQQKAGLMDDLLTGKVRVTELLNHQPPAQ